MKPKLACKYLQYFYFLSTNWNIRIAWHIIRNEIRGNIKYQIQSTDVISLRSLKKSGVETKHATFYMPASYDLLEKAFAFIQEKNIHDITDLGCGMARPLCVAAHYGFTHLTGVELSKSLCLKATANLQNTATLLPNISYRILQSDAGTYEIPENTHCIFLFNPFDEIIMQQVAQNIETSIQKHPRNFYIIYLNALHKKCFTDKGFEIIFEYSEKVYLEVTILKKAL